MADIEFIDALKEQPKTDFIKALIGLSLDSTSGHVKSGTDIEVPNQVLPTDPAIIGADQRLITVKNAYLIEQALKQFIDQNFMPNLDPDNPTMQLHVSDQGSAAQMKVIHNGHDVASMEWLKATQEFIFHLADKDTGTSKATFEIKPDGHAYIGGQQVAVVGGGSAVTPWITTKGDANSEGSGLVILDPESDGGSIYYTEKSSFDPSNDQAQSCVVLSRSQVSLMVLEDGTNTLEKPISLELRRKDEQGVISHHVSANVDHAPFIATEDADIVTKKFFDDNASGAVGGLFQFDYKIKTDASDATPAVKFISFDDVDFTQTTKLYINKKDRNNTDMSLFLKAIDTGDYFNIHDNGNVNDFVAFDVTGKAVQNGDVFEVPVTHFDDNGTLTNGERVFIHWNQSEGETVKTITDTADIMGAGVYDGVNVANAPSQGHIMIHVIEDSKGNMDLSLKDETGRRTDGGKPLGHPITWAPVNASHLFQNGGVPDNSKGHNGDLMFII